MSEPSKEAMAAAEKLVRMEVAHETPDCTLVVAGVELYSVNASQGPMSEMYDTVCELQAGIATALDAHTADLQREVEALRAERAKIQEAWDNLNELDIGEEYAIRAELFEALWKVIDPKWYNAKFRVGLSE